MVISLRSAVWEIKKKSIKTIYTNLNPKIPDVLLPLEKGFLSTTQTLPLPLRLSSDVFAMNSVYFQESMS